MKSSLKYFPCCCCCCSVIAHVQLFVTPWTTASQASLSFAIPHSLLKLRSSESVIISNHLILCYPLLLLPSIFHSIRVFPNESALHIRWPNYSNFSFSISPSSNYSELISIKIDFPSKVISWVFYSTTIKKNQFFGAQPFLWFITSLHDYWKNHSINYMDLWQQSDVSAF